MELMGKLPYKNLKLVWVTDFYDRPMKGLCKYMGSICYFEGFYGCKFVQIYSLNNFEKVKWRLNKKLFEIMIGYHWSYPERDNGAKPRNTRFKKLDNFLFGFYFGYVKKLFWGSVMKNKWKRRIKAKGTICHMNQKMCLKKFFDAMYEWLSAAGRALRVVSNAIAKAQQKILENLRKEKANEIPSETDTKSVTDGSLGDGSSAG